MIFSASNCFECDRELMLKNLSKMVDIQEYRSKPSNPEDKKWNNEFLNKPNSIHMEPPF